MTPNTYINEVVYDRTSEHIVKIIALWNTMADAEKQNREPQLPDFILQQYEYLSNISVDKYRVRFTSRFSPNEEVLLAIANQYPADYLHMYFNDKLLIYGVHILSNDRLHEFCMEENDYLLYEEQPDGQFLFEGRLYKLRQDIYKLIIHDKIMASLKQNPGRP